ncbi:glycosyltransferase [Butyrivibrio sp. NC2002]|uniref:glycosyltransferase n=1 Tax=Butyrivibrio sp. NC2002 TaxID=1410610 RepID=UPI0005692046|nr:glycosyltransferase [Butyrivibrio sp. NC2002]
MKKTILWLAPHKPYEKVRHAGGKNMYYYINYINNSGKFDITFIGLSYESERKYDDIEKSGIKTDIYYRDHSKLDSLVRRVVGGFTLLNPWTKYYNLLLLYEHMQITRRVKKYKEQNGDPDIVILHWTAMGLLLPEMRRYFPKAKIIIIEEDVTYLGYKRKYEANPTWLTKYRYEHLKKDELRVISDSDLTVTLNKKDTDLLLNEGIKHKKVYTSTLYFEDYSDVQRNPKPGYLLFYGAMSRPENYESVIDFIENAMPDFAKAGCTLNVVGANPHQRLIAAADKFNNDFQGSKKPINITGFVDDIRPYLADAMCMVAPLKLGAGIKVKVLEAMSAGVTVLTNDIGIEGIYARNRLEYIHCERPEDYINEAKNLLNNMQETIQIGNAAKNYIAQNYNLDMKLGELLDIISIW